MEQGMMRRGDAREQEEVPAAMLPFCAWVIEAGPTIFLEVLKRVVVVSEVMDDRRKVTIPPGIEVPDFWAMAQAAEELRDMAQAAGFPEAAAFCEQARQDASGAIASLVELVGTVVVLLSQ